MPIRGTYAPPVRRRMRFTVLGSSGFIGRHLVRALVSGGHECWTPGRDDPQVYGPALGHAIYCIGLTADWRRQPLATVRAHVGILERVLESASFESLVYLSSTRVYRGASSTHESSPLTVRPAVADDLYNISKLMGESMCLSGVRGGVRVARVSNVYGDDVTSENFLTAVTRDAVERGHVELETGLSSSKDYIAVTDVVDLLVSIALRGEQPIYNVASGCNTSHAELIGGASGTHRLHLPRAARRAGRLLPRGRHDCSAARLRVPPSPRRRRPGRSRGCVSLSGSPPGARPRLTWRPWGRTRPDVEDCWPQRPRRMGRPLPAPDPGGTPTMTVQIDPTARVSKLADIEDSVRGSRIVIGAGSVIDSFVKIKPAGGSGDIVIGARTIVNSCCVFYTGNGIVIGDDVAIAANCTFAPVDHEYRARDKLIREQRFKPGRGGIVIEDDVWIGAGCVLLDGAVLRRGCVIGAMSLIRGEVAAYSIQAGNPLRLLGSRE